MFSAEMYASEADATEADVEDILGRSLYVELVDKTYGLAAKQQLPKKRPDGSNERVVAEVEAHFCPCTGVDGVLDRFEALFTALNKLL